MKLAFIVVLYQTPQSDIDRLKLEIRRQLQLPLSSFYCIDNTSTTNGYAAGVNEGLKKAIKDGADTFIIANPDISLNTITSEAITNGLRNFNILGFPFEQSSNNYYGGTIEKMRMSGGLIATKPDKAYISVDFVSGSLMVITKKVIEEIGYFDESYGMYYEDVDYCYHAKETGLKVGISTEAKYIHYESSRNSALKNIYLYKNRFRFLMKYGNLKQKLYELMRLPKTIWQDRHTIIDLLKNKEVLLGFMSLNISSLVNKLLNFLIFIFLVHILSPHNYGIYILVWAQATILSPMVDLGTTSYGLLHVNDKDQDRISNLYSLRFFTAIAVFIITMLLSLFLGYDSPTLTFIFLTSFIIISNMFSGTLLITTAISRKLYLPSVLSIGANLLYTIATISCLLIFHNLLSVFIVIFFFYLSYAMVNFIFLKKEVPHLTLKINLTEWQSIMRKSYVFILISLFAGLYFKIDIFLLNFLQGKEAVGVYSSGYKFFEAFMFIAASFTTASTPIYVRLAKENKHGLFKRIQRDVYLLVMIGILIGLITYSISPFIIPHIVGSKYTEAVQVLQIVIMALPFIFLSTILINTLYVLERSYYVIYVFLVQIFFNGILNWFLIPKYSYIASSYLTVFSEIINTTLFFILIYKLTHLKENEYLR